MSLTNAITTKQSLLGTGVVTGVFSTGDALTYADLYDISLFGITLGGWVFLLGLISVLLIVILNAIKMGGMIALALRHKKVIETIEDDSTLVGLKLKTDKE